MTLNRFLIIVLGLLFVSGLLATKVYAYEAKSIDLPVNYQSMPIMPAFTSRNFVLPVAFKPAVCEYRFSAERIPFPHLYPELGRLPPMLATPTPTPQGQNASGKSHLVLFLVGGLVVLMALFIVVVVKVLKKLKDLSNGR